MANLTTILICGGSCSGKTVFANLFRHALVLELDHFYLGKKDMKSKPDGSYDFDAPEAVNLAEAADAVKTLSQGKTATIPVYDMKVSDRTGTQTVQPKPDDTFLVVPGIFSFHEPLRQLGDLKIYLDTPR